MKVLIFMTQFYQLNGAERLGAELAEELNMRILEIVAQAGTTLSLPARTLHIEQTDGAGKAAVQ